jgi:hypothetical protein
MMSSEMNGMTCFYLRRLGRNVLEQGLWLCSGSESFQSFAKIENTPSVGGFGVWAAPIIA